MSMISKRRFLLQLGRGAVAALAASTAWPADRTGARMPPVALFSKVYQELKLDFAQSADTTAEAGLDGIDCPVRPGGQVLPERVTDDLPRYDEALKQRNCKLLLLTTGILNPQTPHAESILRTAKKLGVKYYRLGYWNYTKDKSPETTLREIKPQLRELASLNKEIGVCALLQNHAGATLVGAQILDFYELVRDLDPDQVALAFDIGHAINTLNEDWPGVFEKVKSHCRVAYIKDWKRGQGFVPFGAGEIGASGFFSRFKAIDRGAPISMHTEYHWADGAERTRAQLVRALQRDLKLLKQWWV
jgi:sugar phosphate isomerase/epimerase